MFWKNLKLLLIIHKMQRGVTENVIYEHMVHFCMWKAYKLFLSCCWTPVSSSRCHRAINHPTLGTAICPLHQAVATAAKWSTGPTLSHNSGAPSIIFIVIWVSDQRTTTPSGTRGYFPITKELQRNSWFRRGFFPRPCASSVGCVAVLQVLVGSKGSPHE